MSEQHNTPPAGGAPVEVPAVIEPQPAIPAAQPSATPAVDPAAAPPLAATESGTGVAEPAPAGLKPHTDTATLLEAGATPPAAPAAPPAEGATGAAAAAVEQPAPEPHVYEFKLPEGFELKPEQQTEVSALFNELGIAPGDNAQKLVDYHAGALQRFADQLRQKAHDDFAGYRREWADQVRGDDELGGAGHNTAMARIARMRDLFVEPARRQAFTDFLRATGAGDHPEFLRILHNVGRRFDEPTPAPPPNNPPPDRGRPPGAQGRGARASGFYKTPGS